MEKLDEKQEKVYKWFCSNCRVYRYNSPLIISKSSLSFRCRVCGKVTHRTQGELI